MQHSYTKITVDLNEYSLNIQKIRDALQNRLLLVIKANAYGLGAAGLVPAISSFPDVMVGVAVVDEALELRQADYMGNILVMGYTPPEHYKLALRHFLSLGVYRPENIPLLEDAAAELGTVAKVHIKLDTGMHRVGTTPEVLPELLDRIAENPHVAVEGIYSHLAGTSKPGDALIPQQTEIFRECAEEIETRLGVSAIKHIANSTGVKPVIRFSTQVVDARRLPADTGVSYGHKYKTRGETCVVTIPVGYADGIPYQFFPGGQVLFRGKRREVAGVVNMDYMMINAENEPEVQVGEEVVLIGGQESEEITLSEFAAFCGTINYDIICKLGRRIKREYVS
jgi:alanine racemase